MKISVEKYLEIGEKTTEICIACGEAFARVATEYRIYGVTEKDVAEIFMGKMELILRKCGYS